MNWKVMGDEQTTFTIIQEDEDSATVIGWSDEEKYARLMAASNELLECVTRMRNQLYSAGYESKENSLNPTEDLLFQIEMAIERAKGL